MDDFFRDVELSSLFWTSTLLVLALFLAFVWIANPKRPKHTQRALQTPKANPQLSPRDNQTGNAIPDTEQISRENTNQPRSHHSPRRPNPQGPVFLVLNAPTPTKTGISNATVAGLAPVFSSISAAADIAPHDEEGLLINLHFKVYQADAAQHRNGWFGGRLYNKFAGENPDYVPLSGTHLVQTLALIGIEAPDFVIARGQYALRLDLAKDALAAIKKSSSAKS